MSTLFIGDTLNSQVRACNLKGLHLFFHPAVMGVGEWGGVVREGQREFCVAGRGQYVWLKERRTRGLRD